MQTRFVAMLQVISFVLLFAAPSNALPPDDSSDDLDADWPSYNHDVMGWRFNRAERTLSPTNAGSLVENWRFPAAEEETIGVVHATPTVVDGEVYFGTATFPAFYKLSRDGKQIWIYRNPLKRAVLPPTNGAPVTEKLRGAASTGGIFSSALVNDGLVYFADVGGWMYCLEAATGNERWKIDTRDPMFPGAHASNVAMASPIIADGKIVFAGGSMEQLYAGTSTYHGSIGRGFLVALDPKTGAIGWKFDLGPKPEKFAKPVTIVEPWGSHVFDYGPATSSIWSTPSFDRQSNLLYFGTDVNTAPRQPTDDNPNLYTEDSCAVFAIDAATGDKRWSTQLSIGDVWTNAMCGYDYKTGLYKDQSIGDTPKIISLRQNGTELKVLGVGCKNGGFYLLNAEDGSIIRHTPIYTGTPTEPPAPHDPRVLALPSQIGGLQTGCATDGTRFFVNGIDALRLGALPRPQDADQIPTGGRVTSISVDLGEEHWRHERPKIAELGPREDAPMYHNVGDVVASGIALGNGVAYFTTVGSSKLVAIEASSGKVLKEILLGPVFAGPALSRGHVYIGTGNTLWTPADYECFFPKKYTGRLHCFGLPKSNNSSEFR